MRFDSEGSVLVQPLALSSEERIVSHVSIEAEQLPVTLQLQHHSSVPFSRHGDECDDFHPARRSLIEDERACNQTIRPGEHNGIWQTETPPNGPAHLKVKELGSGEARERRAEQEQIIQKQQPKSLDPAKTSRDVSLDLKENRRGDEEASELEGARLERLGRERPAKFKTVWAEVAFCYSILASQIMAVSGLPLETISNPALQCN